MRDLLEFAKTGAPGRKYLRAVDDQPSIYFERQPFAHLDAVTRLTLNPRAQPREDIAQSFKRRKNGGE